MFSDEQIQCIDEFFRAHNIQGVTPTQLQTVYYPLYQQIDQRRPIKKPLIIGINGSNGSGKSTLVSLLARLFILKKYSCACLSIDDFYINKLKRNILGKSIHPLLNTRSIATLDADLLEQTLQKLQLLSSSESMRVPRFDKATDDHMPEERWPVIEGPIDIIFLEGFCISLTGQSKDDLEVPINILESEQDRQSIWRQRGNDVLSQLQSVFTEIDFLVYLQVDDFAQVQVNRYRTELALARDCVSYPSKTPAELASFIAYYERMFMLQKLQMPHKADYIVLAKDLYAPE